VTLHLLTHAWVARAVVRLPAVLVCSWSSERAFDVQLIIISIRGHSIRCGVVSSPPPSFGRARAAMPDDITAVHGGLDGAAAAAAFGNVPDHVMTDHFGHDVAAYENMTHLHSRCQQALKRAIWEEEHDLPPYLHADPLEGVQLGERDKVTDPRIVYFIGATRPTAAIMVSRLILALYHASHLFLVHVDLKAEGVYEQIDNVVRQHPNIHMLGTRRLVQVPCTAPSMHILPPPRPHAYARTPRIARRTLHARTPHTACHACAVGLVDDDAAAARRPQDHHRADDRL